MTLEELGAALRAKREERGLSLENVSERLKISTSHLDALEKGDLSGMPHTAYAKGFLRSYARYLGLPEDEYRPVLDSLSPDRSSVATEPLFEPDVSARPHRDTRWIGIVLSLALACLIAWAVWRFGLIDFVAKESGIGNTAQAPMQTKNPQDGIAAGGQNASMAGSQVTGSVDQKAQPAGQKTDSGLGDMQAPAQRTPNMPAGAGSATSAGSPSLNATGAGRQPLAGVVPADSPWGTLQGNATLAGKAGLAGNGTKPSPQAANPNMPPNADLSALPGQHKIVLIAEETCWMQATADSGKPDQHTMKKGETLTFPFTAKLVLRLGNAGGVRIIYDGQELLDRGRSGQVRTMTFPPMPQ